MGTLNKQGRYLTWPFYQLRQLLRYNYELLYLFWRKLTWLLPVILYWICSCNVLCCWYSIVYFLNAWLQAWFLLLRGFTFCQGKNCVLRWEGYGSFQSKLDATLGNVFWFVNDAILDLHGNFFFTTNDVYCEYCRVYCSLYWGDGYAINMDKFTLKN